MNTKQTYVAPILVPQGSAAGRTEIDPVRTQHEEPVLLKWYPDSAL